MSMKLIFDEIVEERWKQNGKWGGADHDDTHNANDWQRYIRSHAAALTDTQSAREYRKELIQIAALAVAAVESLDRKN